MTDLELKERLANIDKMQQETLKLQSEFELNRTRLKWYEVTMLLAIIGVTVTITKLFL